MAKRKKATPMRAAITELHERASGTGLATPQDIKEVADKFDLECSELECKYLDECDEIAKEETL